MNINNLGFKPNTVCIGWGGDGMTTVSLEVPIVVTSNVTSIGISGTTLVFKLEGNAYLSDDGFLLPVSPLGNECTWIAYE